MGRNNGGVLLGLRVGGVVGAAVVGVKVVESSRGDWGSVSSIWDAEGGGEMGGEALMISSCEGGEKGGGGSEGSVGGK